MTAAASVPAVEILVAEDDKYDRMILAEALKEAGVEVSLHFVSNGEELLDDLRGRKAGAGRRAAAMPVLVLMDLNMPRMNGQDALKLIRADPALRMLPVMILSTSDNPKQVVQAYESGANAFMTKPGRFEDLVRMLQSFSTFWLEQATLPKTS